MIIASFCHVKTTLTDLILNVNIGPQHGWSLNEYERGKLNKSWNSKEVYNCTYKYTDWLIDQYVIWLIETAIQVNEKKIFGIREAHETC